MSWLCWALLEVALSGTAQGAGRLLTRVASQSRLLISPPWLQLVPPTAVKTATTLHATVIIKNEGCVRGKQINEAGKL